MTEETEKNERERYFMNIQTALIAALLALISDRYAAQFIEFYAQTVAEPLRGLFEWTDAHIEFETEENQP